MATPSAVTRPARSTLVALLVTSCGLLGLQAWSLLRWVQAFDRGSTPAERVQRYLHELPMGVGTLGMSAVTWLSLLCAVISLVTAIVAGRLLTQTARAATLVIAGINAILVLWYLFTLM